MKERLQQVAPKEIEAQSMKIIEAELKGRKFPPEQLPVILRVIHTSADFDYADNLIFSKNAIRTGLDTIRAGCTIVTDTKMAQAGINKRVLAGFGGAARCFIADEDVAEEAKRRGLTRSAVSMERAAQIEGPLILALGNAPTALVRACELMEEGAFSPKLIIGVPVGFVNVVESKELLLSMPGEQIVAKGRKGGSNVAAAICNALLYTADLDFRLSL